MSISQAWAEIRQWMNIYTTEHLILFILAIDALIYLLIANKRIRKSMIIPILCLIPIIINPILYKYVYKGLRYWRFFWILPEVVLIGLAFADLSKKINKQWVKCVSLIATAGTLMIMGQNVFLPKAGEFKPKENLYKIDQSVKQNCDIILADNPYPKCIFQRGFTQTRQYSGNITQMYARDVEGYIIGPSKEARIVYNSWNGEPEEQEYIFTVAQEKGYTHICCRTTEGFDEMADQHGFSILSKTDDWTIYHRKTQEENEA